jgi:hypothetical protein
MLRVLPGLIVDHCGVNREEAPLGYPGPLLTGPLFGKGISETFFDLPGLSEGPAPAEGSGEGGERIGSRAW